MAIPIGIGALAVNVAALVDTTFLQTRINHIMSVHPEPLLTMYQGMIPDLEVKIATGTVSNFCLAATRKRWHCLCWFLVLHKHLALAPYQVLRQHG